MQRIALDGQHRDVMEGIELPRLEYEEVIQ